MEPGEYPLVKVLIISLLLFNSCVLTQEVKFQDSKDLDEKLWAVALAFAQGYIEFLALLQVLLSDLMTMISYLDYSYFYNRLLSIVWGML